LFSFSKWTVALLEKVLEESGAGHEAAETAGQHTPHALCLLLVLVQPRLVHHLTQDLISQWLVVQTLQFVTMHVHFMIILISA
jgi:hypothetical protein